MPSYFMREASRLKKYLLLSWKPFIRSQRRRISTSMPMLRRLARRDARADGKIVARARGDEPLTAEGGIAHAHQNVVQGAVAADDDKLAPAPSRELAGDALRIPLPSVKCTS